MKKLSKVKNILVDNTSVNLFVSDFKDDDRKPSSLTVRILKRFIKNSFFFFKKLYEEDF